MTGMLEGHIVPIEPAHMHAVTDLGRELDVFRFGDSDPDDDLERAGPGEYGIAASGHSSHRSGLGLQLSWLVFAGGRYGVPSTSVDIILADNGYTEVTEARQGDLVVYRNELGIPVHTGLVRFVGSDGLVLVESKWGPLGLFLHAPEAQPYGHRLGYYRSPRRGHWVALRPGIPGVPNTSGPRTGLHRGAAMNAAPMFSWGVLEGTSRIAARDVSRNLNYLGAALRGHLTPPVAAASGSAPCRRRGQGRPRGCRPPAGRETGPRGSPRPDGSAGSLNVGTSTAALAT